MRRARERQGAAAEPVPGVEVGEPLRRVLDLLVSVHNHVYNGVNDDSDVVAMTATESLAIERRAVLGNVRLCFTGIFMRGGQPASRDPHFRMALAHGATVSPNVDDRVTHVVAHNPSTVKVRVFR